MDPMTTELDGIIVVEKDGIIQFGLFSKSKINVDCWVSQFQNLSVVRLENNVFKKYNVTKQDFVEYFNDYPMDAVNDAASIESYNEVYKKFLILLMVISMSGYKELPKKFYISEGNQDEPG